MEAPPTPRHSRHHVDIFLPYSSNGCRPRPKGLIVFIPGGAWKGSGSLDSAFFRLPSLIPPDFALAILNYTLSARKREEELKIQHPCHVQDVKAAVEWLVKDGAGGLEEETRGNVWLIGHSAGVVSRLFPSQLQAVLIRLSKTLAPDF